MSFSFGDALEGFGKAYAVTVAVITTIVAIVIIKKVLMGDAVVTINGKEVVLRKEFALAGVAIIAMSWFIVWLVEEYKLFAQINGGLGIFNVASVLI